MKNERSHMSGSKLTGAEISAYFRKNPRAKAVKKAVEIALDHGGAMTYAIKQIEKLKRGLSKHPEVKKALDHANFESVQRESIQTVNRIISENYTKNFDLLCNSIKLNKVQQKILDQFINHGTIKNQYVGRVAGVKKEKKFFAAKKQYKGSIDNRNEALMKALKVNTHQKKILDSYLKTGKVIGKYAGSIAGSTKTTKSYSAFRGFKEHFDSTPELWELNETTVKTSILSDWDGPGNIQTHIKKVAKEFKVKATFKNGAGNGTAGPDLAIFTGSDKDLIKFVNEFFGSVKNTRELKAWSENVKNEKRKFKFQKESFVIGEGKQGLSSVNRDIEGNGGSLGGFSLNFDSSSDEKNALKAVEKFAKKNRIRDYGTYVYSGMGSAKGRTQVYIKNNKVDVSDLYREVGTKANVVGKSVAGMQNKGSFKWRFK